MDNGRFIRIFRNGKFADGIYTRGLPYPLGVVDIPAIINGYRSCYSSIGREEHIHLNDADRLYLRNWVLEAGEGGEISLIDSHDAAQWRFVMERANY